MIYMYLKPAVKTTMYDNRISGHGAICISNREQRGVAWEEGGYIKGLQIIDRWYRDEWRIWVIDLLVVLDYSLLHIIFANTSLVPYSHLISSTLQCIYETVTLWMINKISINKRTIYIRYICTILRGKREWLNYVTLYMR